ncbi:MAG: hypothetical protein QW303_00485 [Nitrososphaerota archaeon]
MPISLASIGIIVHAKINIRDKTYFLPVSSVSCNYVLAGLNGRIDLPTCILHLAPGFRVIDDFISAAHEFTELIFQIPIEVYIDTYPSDTFEDKLLGKEPSRHLLFKGFVSQIGYEKTATSFTIVLKCLHWLHALDYSSILSSQSHPSNPSDMVFDAFLRMGAGAAARLNFVDAFQAIINPLMVMEDLWMVIWLWFRRLASFDRFGFSGLINDGNFLAQAALDKFLNGIVPLSVRPLDGSVAEEIASTIAARNAAGARFSLLGMAHESTTMWKKIAGELAPMFFFGIATAPDFAQAIPIVPNFRNYYRPDLDLPYTIMTGQVFSIEFGKAVSQPIMGAGLIGSMEMYAGSALNRQGFHTPVVGGLFISRFLDRGMFIFRRAPNYISSLFHPSLVTPFLLFMRGNLINNPINILAMNANMEATSAMISKTIVMNDFAQMLFGTELFSEREMLVKTPLRFDIIPGSTISIEVVTSGFRNETNVFVGLVTDVEYRIDYRSNKPFAFTTYRIAYVRTLSENNNYDFTMNRHPLYTTYAIGGRLGNRIGRIS